MFERYTEPARRVLFFARYEASHRGGLSIESYHLLLGLVRHVRGPIEDILTHFGVNPMALVMLVDEQAPTTRERVATSVEMPFSREVQRVLNLAAEEADALGHKHIGSEHLFLGLLRESGSLAASILTSQRITLEKAREFVAQLPKAGPLDSFSSVRVTRVHGTAADEWLEKISALVDELSRAERGSSEASKLVAQIHSAIDALRPFLL